MGRVRGVTPQGLFGVFVVGGLCLGLILLEILVWCGSAWCNVVGLVVLC